VIQDALARDLLKLNTAVGFGAHGRDRSPAVRAISQKSRRRQLPLLPNEDATAVLRGQAFRGLAGDLRQSKRPADGWTRNPAIAVTNGQTGTHSGSLSHVRFSVTRDGVNVCKLTIWRGRNQEMESLG